MTDGRILVVDDEPAFLDMCVAWLKDEFPVITASSGEEALDILDESVDVVLLDRRMPGLTGSEVLERIRNRDVECRVAMVTAVEPDLDVVEMPFDDYIVKPVSRSEVVETVKTLQKRLSYDTQVQEYFALVSKRAALEAGLPASDLEDSDAYTDLVEDIAEREDALSDTLDRLMEEHPGVVFREFPDGPPDDQGAETTTETNHD